MYLQGVAISSELDAMASLPRSGVSRCSRMTTSWRPGVDLVLPSCHDCSLPLGYIVVQEAAHLSVRGRPCSEQLYKIQDSKGVDVKDRSYRINVGSRQSVTDKAARTTRRNHHRCDARTRGQRHSFMRDHCVGIWALIPTIVTFSWYHDTS